MDSDKYLKGRSMQRQPLFETGSFIYWKNIFETYVKSKDLNLWHVITNGDFQPIQNNPKTKLDEVVPLEKQNDDLKKRLAKNNKAKMVIYNALPRKEYERTFMCNMAKEIWKTLLITHQGNSKVKDNKIDVLVQQYEQFVIFEDESIDSAFARFNTIITNLKALDEGYSSMNYSKDLTSLSLDELIENLKGHEIIIKKDSKIVKAKGERKSLALKAKKESDDEESLTSKSDDEKYVMAVRDFKKFFKKEAKRLRGILTPFIIFSNVPICTGKGLLGPNGGSCGGKGGRGGSMMGRGGGWLAKRSIVLNEGCGGGRLAVRGGNSSSESKNRRLRWCRGGEVNDREVVLGVFKSLLGEIPWRCDRRKCIVRLVKYLKGMGKGMFGTRGDLLNGDVSFLYIIAKEVMSDFYMFGTRVKNGVLAKVDGTFIVTKDGYII
ncbi:hypothetical protein Tco_1362992 [Tanacetum coccineum]